ncbi:zinc-binding alcohol dehydrogenase, partial [bacterium]|nr:zinc-binding alcohol dehydrogenase [bacterium]
MKQFLQNLKSGETEIADIPTPDVATGRLLIQSNRSIISSGTERMLVEFSKANLIDKARKQPEKVKMVLEKIQTDGLFATLDAVQSKLDQTISLGYSNAGVVIDVGEGVNEFSIGDRVISNGCHAEVISVPKNLCTKIPDSVSFEPAAFTVIASIALQGVRLLQPTLGESIAVTGLGLVGLLTVQLLAAHGCRVLGIDFDERKIELAHQFGAETVRLSAGDGPLDAARHFSRGRGMDGVIITASTKSNDPIKQAAEMSRQRGRIVLVGVTGLELSRSEFYAKELSFRVSCSYGPG